MRLWSPIERSTESQRAIWKMTRMRNDREENRRAGQIAQIQRHAEGVPGRFNPVWWPESSAAPCVARALRWRAIISLSAGARTNCTRWSKWSPVPSCGLERLHCTRVGRCVLAGRRIMRKIESVSETTREIVAGDLTRRVLSSTAGDEFDHLAVSINSMLDRIQSLMGELQQVTTDIAHDLRTPLSRLRSGSRAPSVRMCPRRSCAR